MDLSFCSSRCCWFPVIAIDSGFCYSLKMTMKMKKDVRFSVSFNLEFASAEIEMPEKSSGIIVFKSSSLLPYSDEKYRYEIKDILEMEMKVLEALNYYLVVFHPYRSLTVLLQDAGMSDATQSTWGLLNDTYKMDLILVHPPHLITLACVYIAIVLNERTPHGLKSLEST